MIELSCVPITLGITSSKWLLASGSSKSGSTRHFFAGGPKGGPGSSPPPSERSDSVVLSESAIFSSLDRLWFGQPLWRLGEMAQEVAHHVVGPTRTVLLWVYYYICDCIDWVKRFQVISLKQLIYCLKDWTSHAMPPSIYQAFISNSHSIDRKLTRKNVTTAQNVQSRSSLGTLFRPQFTFSMIKTPTHVKGER